MKEETGRLDASERRYRTLFENMDEGFCAIEMIYDPDGKPVDYRFVEINNAFVRQTGLHQALEKTMREMVPDHDAHWFEIYGKVARTGESIRFQNPAAAMGRFYDVFAFRIGGNGSREVGILFNDVTESKKMEEVLREKREELERRVRERTADLAKANDELRREAKEKAELQAQLIQSQKMEAVGRLAGGVAHDFNNLLTAIGGYSNFLLGALAPDDKRRVDVEQIKIASERAAALTRQLLAFSRQQVLQLKVLDCNALVSELENMLQRIIGEDVTLATQLDAKTGRIKADAGQIGQVLMNLVVNAKDAMPKGGRITIETSNVDLKEDYARMHLQVKPGSYVMFVVSDTGTGMDAKTLSHLFEPFFTTKEQGKGTGLGLATVYGIVKQSGGGIYVYSEPGHGTTFKIYLPRVEGAVQPAAAGPIPLSSFAGSETILLVEDEELVRVFIARALRESGYTVLAARNPAEAIRLCEQRRDPLHLILTDVIMPQMHGPELLKRLSLLHPESKAIFMSGYTDTTVAHHDLLDGRVPFLQKPLAPDVLARKVREVLDESGGRGP
ncbi:MAG: response regulator [Elusimicrobia bacterium]|nr:response regulator [Elusimicrobiota bacterium]